MQVCSPESAVSYPDFDKLFALTIDRSNYAIVAISSQKNRIHAEINYSTIHKATFSHL